MNLFTPRPVPVEHHPQVFDRLFPHSTPAFDPKLIGRFSSWKKKGIRFCLVNLQFPIEILSLEGEYVALYLNSYECDDDIRMGK